MRKKSRMPDPRALKLQQVMQKLQLQGQKDWARLKRLVHRMEADERRLKSAARRWAALELSVDGKQVS